MQPESRRSRLAAHATLLAAATLVAVLAHAAPALEELGNFPRATVEIASGDRVHRFDVWVADTPERQAQGLMFVRDLAKCRCG